MYSVAVPIYFSHQSTVYHAPRSPGRICISITTLLYIYCLFLSVNSHSLTFFNSHSESVLNDRNLPSRIISELLKTRCVCTPDKMKGIVLNYNSTQT